jgi:hypothetical protein
MPAPLAKDTFRTPRCLAFLDKPFVAAGDVYVTLAKIRSLYEEATTASRPVSSFWMNLHQTLMHDATARAPAK